MSNFLYSINQHVTSPKYRDIFRIDLPHCEFLNEFCLRKFLYFCYRLEFLCAFFICIIDRDNTLETNKTNFIFQSKPPVSEICKKCDCQVEEKTVDCQDLDIENMFSDEEFIAFNNSKVPQDIFRQKDMTISTNCRSYLKIISLQTQ